MLQAVMTRPGEIKFRDVPIPDVGCEQVLVKTMKIGICGSDIHVYHGRHPYTSYPVVQGHETSGRVIEVGEDVSSIQRGDKVTVCPQIICGKCYQCTHGLYHLCEELQVMGFQTTGTASEFFVIDATNAIRLPEEVSYDEGAMVEPLAVGIHALRRSVGIERRNILVLGAGPIGNLTSQAASAMGADSVMVTDISDRRLEIADYCGIDHCINVAEANLQAIVTDRFGDKQADCIIECVGAGTSIRQAIKVARKGTDIVVVGVFADPPTIDLGLVQDRELRLIGSLMYLEEDFECAVQLIEEKKVDLDPLITDVFSFRDYQLAYQHIDNEKDRSMKVLISIGEE